jgi:hypothetical protein
MEDVVKVPLKHPIEAHGEKVSELELKEPTLGVLDDVEITVKGDGSVALNLGDLHKLVANMADIPPTAAKQIRVSDMGEIAKAVMGFLSEFLPTGGS